MNQTYDAIVLGAGVIGASVAYNLSQRGLKVWILERQTVGAGATGQLAAGASITAKGFVFIPLATLPGTYYLGAFVDPTNLQVESNETNNTFTGPTIQVLP